MLKIEPSNHKITKNSKEYESQSQNIYHQQLKIKKIQLLVQNTDIFIK